ncbi:hypothetical protein N2152v2_001759 [Parachlorella kessleri]
MEVGEEQFHTAYKAYLKSQGLSIDSVKFSVTIGGQADLYKAYTYARKYGGFHGVDKAKRWRDMASTLGANMTTSVSSSIKATYDKLLRPFEEWLEEHPMDQGDTPGWEQGQGQPALLAPPRNWPANTLPWPLRASSREAGGLHPAHPSGAPFHQGTRLSPAPGPGSAPLLSPQLAAPGEWGAPQAPGGVGGPPGLASFADGIGRQMPLLQEASQGPRQPSSLPNGGLLQQARKRKAEELGPGTGHPSQGQQPELQQQPQRQPTTEVVGAAQLTKNAAPAAIRAAAATGSAGPRGDGGGGGGQGLLQERLLGELLPSQGPVLQVASSLLEEQGERVVGALRSGIPSQESWALNALGLLSFHHPILLPNLPGLVEALVKLLWRGFPPAAPLAAPNGPQLLPPPPCSTSPSAPGQPYPAAAAAAATPGLACAEALERWSHLFPCHPQLEYRAQAAAAAAQVLFNAAAAVEANAAAAHSMYDHPPGGTAQVQLRWQCQQPFLQEAALSVLHMLERLAPHVALPQPLQDEQQRQEQRQQQQQQKELGSAAGKGAAAADVMLRLLPGVVALVAPGRPLLPLQLCCAALDTLNAWAAAGTANAAAVQACCTPGNLQLLRNMAELLACPFDDIRVQAEEQLEEEGGFPEGPDMLGGGVVGGRGGMDGGGGGSPGSEDGGSGLREVCIDMATIIKQVRLLASAMQLLLRVVSSQAVEVRRSVAVHAHLVKLLAGVAAHDHPGYPLSWQVNPARAAHLTAIKDRMLPLFEHRSIVLKQARVHATTILASLAFDPATRQYVLPYEAQILQQVMSGRVPADGPMNALLAAFCRG